MRLRSISSTVHGEPRAGRAVVPPGSERHCQERAHRSSHCICKEVFCPKWRLFKTCSKMIRSGDCDSWEESRGVTLHSSAIRNTNLQVLGSRTCCTFSTKTSLHFGFGQKSVFQPNQNCSENSCVCRQFPDLG